MPFVASPAQVEACKQICSVPSYTQEAIVVEFQTTTDFVRSVLSPHLEPASTPSGLINIGNWQSNACGDFELSRVSVRCKNGDLEGYYTLTLIVSDPFAITWRRETWGEVRKPGKPRLFGSGARKYAHYERGAGGVAGTEDAEWYAFEVKGFPAASGGGLQNDPVDVTLKVVDHNVKRANAKGRWTLRGSESDPLHTISITSIEEFQYISGPTDWSVLRTQVLVDSDERYLPFIVGRHYDDFSDFPVAPGLPNFCAEPSATAGFSQARTFSSLS